MLKPMIRTIDRWRFELPLALTLGAAVAFATIAAPHAYFGADPDTDASTMQIVLQDMVAVVVALFATSIAYLAMRRPVAPAPAVADNEYGDWLEPKETAEPEIARNSSIKPGAAASADPQIRLRRADAHPDAPPRAPIRASRDLGEPFMDIDGFAPPPPLEPLVVPPIIDAHFDEIEEPAPTVADGQPVAIDPEAPASATPEPVAGQIPSSRAPETAFFEPVQPEVVEPAYSAPVAEDVGPVAEPVVEPPVVEQAVVEQPVVEPPVEQSVAASPVIPEASPIEAFEPEAEPSPVPMRPARQSLQSMMERLSSGIERRNGRPLAPPPAATVAEALAEPRDVKPELRDALDELNRLARRD